MSKGLDVIALALGKKYTDETVLGGGAIKGKNCTIKSIDDITGGHRINFEWTLDDGTVKADTLDVMDGVNGTNGTNGKDGKDGTNGVDGKDGIGIPNGGTTGQVLKKKSNTDYDTEWQDEEGGAVDSVNGQTGAVILDAEDVGAVEKVQGKGLSENDYTDADKAIVDGVTSALAGKVDKETGKSLINPTTVVDGASYDSTNHLILFKNGTTTLFSLDAAAFVKDGMVDDVEITGGNLVITFNTDAGKQDISIPLTDIFDPTNYYNKTATDSLLADKADETEIADIVNVYGAKNLIPYPYLNKNGTVFRGVTYTVNVDGSVTANGTATGGDSAFFVMQRNVDNDFLSKIGQGSFILSGCPAGGSLQTYYLNFNYGDAQSSMGNLGQDTGNGKEIIIDTDITQYNAQISVLIREGTTVSNLTFYPMLRMASISDNTYVPYVPTNAKLNEEKMSYADNGVLGAKNLLTYPYYNTTKTQNGVTFTDNGDGTVTVNGTATDGVVFFCSIRGENGKCILPNGKYVVTGCPNGGAANSYKIGASRITGGSGTTYGMDIGNGLTITLDGDDFGDDDVRLQIGIAVSEGTVCNNLVFKPMVRLASDPDNTYQPYAMTNKELTEELSNITSGTITPVSNNITILSDTRIRTKLGITYAYIVLKIETMNAGTIQIGTISEGNRPLSDQIVCGIVEDGSATLYQNIIHANIASNGNVIVIAKESKSDIFVIINTSYISQ